jgi:tartrate-resistant acid phosphatase type 5
VVEKPDGTRVHGPLSDAPGSLVDPSAPTKAQQLAWLEGQMKTSTADYLWVGGHYPVWTGCAHGNTAELHTDLKPLLEKYHASGCVCSSIHHVIWSSERP